MPEKEFNPYALTESDKEKLQGIEPGAPGGGNPNYVFRRVVLNRKCGCTYTDRRKGWRKLLPQRHTCFRRPMVPGDVRWYERDGYAFAIIHEYFHNAHLADGMVMHIPDMGRYPCMIVVNKSNPSFRSYSISNINQESLQFPETVERWARMKVERPNE